MRLVTAAEQGGLKVTRDLSDPLPPYAILSHTWREHDDEVTFDDIEKRQGMGKSGYRKLEFCMSQAKRDGLEHAWIDTCCINRANQSELSEAVTSMFQWYRKAAKCYVYMSDVAIQHGTDGLADPAWEAMFRDSRWFTRGWTLQELIAPPSVEFFAENGQRLGDKASLEHELHQITNIPVAALRGADLSEFPVDQRLQWAAGRNTKKAEDRAYCLIGLCKVSMSLRYGEGENAFKRLEAKVRKKDAEGHQNERQWSDGADATTRREGIMASLFFPDMDARRQQISPPSTGTFRWLLEEHPSHMSPGSDIANFIRDESDNQNLFWVSGIPGSGKSSLMAYLFEYLQRDLTWVSQPSHSPGILASYFFWNPASNVLQKSLSGMMRTILYSLFEQDPSSICSAVTLRRWQLAQSKTDSAPSWTQLELLSTLENFIRHRKHKNTILLFLDGLDEIEGGSDGQESVVVAIQKMVNLPSIKLCVSSRPLPVFAEAFGHIPLLRLQDLNQMDISRFVNDAMYGQKSFQTLGAYYPERAQNLIRKIISRAEGVFLWVRLVVKDLICCLRDGGDFAALNHTLEEIPTELESYFQRILDSIDERYQIEASIMLQVALWGEPEFTSLETLRLLDFCLLGDAITGSSQSVTRPISFKFKDDREVRFKLNATFRKLQSRCKGLLACHYLPGLTAQLGESHLAPLVPSHGKRAFKQSLVDDDAIFLRPSSPLRGEHDDLFAFDFSVGFLHRSLHDFLLSPGCLRRLQALTGGPADVRYYLVMTRLHEAEALVTAGLSADVIVFLASHVISAAATYGERYQERTLHIMARLEPVVQHLVSLEGWEPRGLYIGTSLCSWIAEESNFLTLAIDFDIEIYITRHLTPDQIWLKRGRPLLDYVLRPRFTGNSELGIGLTLPDPTLVARMIHLGADPNMIYDGCSLIALYLCFMNDYLRTNHAEMVQEEVSSFYDTTAILLQGPVPAYIPETWLSHRGHFDTWYVEWRDEPRERLSAQDRFYVRWANGPPLRRSLATGTCFSFCTADVVEHFRPFFGDGVDSLVLMAGQH